MQVEINSRGNGACPLCTSHKRCVLQRSILNALESNNSGNGEALELVIYKCPRFKEII